MAVTATHQAAPVSPEVQALEALERAREQTLRLIAHVGEEDLMRVHSPIMSPLVWDLGHIAAYEDLWLAHRHAGLELLRGDLAGLYDAFETPRAVRGEIEALGPVDARAYMDAVRERVATAIVREGVGDGQACEMVVRHELQHTETMRQTLAIAGLLPDGEPMFERVAGEDEWIEVPAGPFEMGAGAGEFSYDNERPRHEVDVPAFQISRLPVRNAAWARFSEQPVGGDPDMPMCHLSWHDAQAFAAAAGARLPTEAEWEKAAASGALDGVGQVWEWTDSVFTGYPGFVAHPYREYSEVFFDRDYRVLRGGSWATDPRVKTVTFRNWDLPQRRQIFAGLRLARDWRRRDGARSLVMKSQAIAMEPQTA